MPQEKFEITISADDTTYIIHSRDEFLALPDSLKENSELLQKFDSLTYITKNPVESRSEDDMSAFFFIGLFVIIALIIYKSREAGEQLEEEKLIENNNILHAPQHLIYRGNELALSENEVRSICTKYNPFYAALALPQQDKFVQRLGQFIYSKDFYIMSSQGYKEMPILIAAAAIQISFGLQEYNFPHFSYIIIHPEEYIAYDPLRILIGNVQGNSIAISWKHFLEDYANPADGKNVGLHEMAHALQVQHLFQNYGHQNEFRSDFEYYDRIDDEVLLSERNMNSNLFDENALNNPNEFWATCVELFFEKPAQLNNKYPHLYNSISMVLNQDTLLM